MYSVDLSIQPFLYVGITLSILLHDYQTLENKQKPSLYVDIELLKKNNTHTNPLKILMYMDIKNRLGTKWT